MLIQLSRFYLYCILEITSAPIANRIHIIGQQQQYDNITHIRKYNMSKFATIF